MATNINATNLDMENDVERRILAGISIGKAGVVIRIGGIASMRVAALRTAMNGCSRDPGVSCM